MYLTGERYFHGRDVGKHPCKSMRYELGYWRKHPNLHGFIVENFAGGIDDCREIHLDEQDLRKLLQAVIDNELPFTDGPFFGITDGTERDDDIRVFTEAIDWLKQPDEPAWRSVSYQASW